ncbi:MAG: hypothetical protein JO167_14645 [Alphaproteobacteria bacterium]|nr:hypothetical protein [Alphaproteobacteria bacterium]MBV9903497.1 hypothetical protein [Alphaproteobacteria bacterium]
MAKFAEPKGSLSDGADRFDRIVRGVKDRQLSEVTNAPAPKTVGNAFAVSPEETWSKQFMTAGIGPQTFSAPQMPAVAIAAPVANNVVFRAVDPAAAPAPKTKAAARAPSIRPEPIGAAIAKPGRKRSWFGRLVRGS